MHLHLENIILFLSDFDEKWAFCERQQYDFEVRLDVLNDEQ